MKFDCVILEEKNKSIYRLENKIYKIFNEDYSKSDVLNEALNQARVEEIGITIPKLHEVTKIDGKWAIVYDYIEGKTLEELMNENPDKIDEYINLFVDLQISMHQHNGLGLNKLKDKMDRKIRETDLSATVKYELHTRLESMPKHKKVCHGDFNPSNIIIDKSGTPYIIDWAHVTQGNASADVARSYLLFCLKGKKELAEKYLNLFCKKSDTAKQYVQKWMPIVAASQSVKDKKEEKEFLYSWIDVVEYE